MDRGLNRNQIKYIAVIAMLIDHTAMFFLSGGLAEASLTRIAVYSLMRVIGRLTGPVMLFFLVEGFTHTSSRKKYGIRLLVFGLLSQIPYALSHYDSLWRADFNVILTLFMTFLMLTAAERIRNRLANGLAVFTLILATARCDWGIIGPLMAWLFYLSRDDRKRQMKYYSFVCAVQVAASAVSLAMKGLHWYGELWQAGMFLVIPVLLCYNGDPGSRSPFNKWLFYVIYPLHLLVIWVIRYHLPAV